MTGWQIYWLCWIFLGFGIPEGIALANDTPGDTLSETVWHFFGVYRNQPISQWSFWHFLLLALMTWLFFHFVLGLFR